MRVLLYMMVTPLIVTCLANVVATSGADWLIDDFLTTNAFEHVLNRCQERFL